jgi:hypothetical protein
MVIGTLVLAAVIVVVVVVGFFALAIVIGLLVAGLLVVAVDRLLLALSPRRRERRARQGAVFTWRTGTIPSGPVIDATATETTGDGERRSGGGPPELPGNG